MVTAKHLEVHVEKAQNIENKIIPKYPKKKYKAINRHNKTGTLFKLSGGETPHEIENHQIYRGRL